MQQLRLKTANLLVIYFGIEIDFLKALANMSFYDSKTEK